MRATALALAFLASASFAQTWPAKPVRFVSTFTAGSPADALMRMAAQKMSDSVGQAAVVEVVAGAGGVIGAQAVARAAPDGHTLLYTLATTIIISPQLVKVQPYELKDFTPIVVVSKAATCMVASTALGVNNIKELIDYARANPGKIAYGTNGIGGSYHLEMEMLRSKHGLNMVHVPYKGGTDALLAAVAGTLPVAFAPLASGLAQQRSGKVKVLAVLDYKRLPDAPDVPSMGEQMPDYEKVATGVDIYGPAGIPAPVLKRVHAELEKAYAQPDVRARMREITFPWDGMALDEMAAQRRKDLDISARAIKAAGLRNE